MSWKVVPEQQRELRERDGLRNGRTTQKHKVLNGKYDPTPWWTRMWTSRLQITQNRLPCKQAHTHHIQTYFLFSNILLERHTAAYLKHTALVATLMSPTFSLSCASFMTAIKSNSKQQCVSVRTCCAAAGYRFIRGLASWLKVGFSVLLTSKDLFILPAQRALWRAQAG